MILKDDKLSVCEWCETGNEANTCVSYPTHSMNTRLHVGKWILI